MNKANALRRRLVCAGLALVFFFAALCTFLPTKAAERDSDLTLGDAWGVEQVFPDLDDDRVTSVVLVQTEKGERMLERIAPKLTLRDGELDTLLPPTADSRKSVVPHPKREAVFQAFGQGEPIASLIKKMEPSFARKVKWRLKYEFNR